GEALEIGEVDAARGELRTHLRHFRVRVDGDAAFEIALAERHGERLEVPLPSAAGELARAAEIRQLGKGEAQCRRELVQLPALERETEVDAGDVEWLRDGAVRCKLDLAQRAFETDGIGPSRIAQLRKRSERAGEAQRQRLE